MEARLATLLPYLVSHTQSSGTQHNPENILFSKILLSVIPVLPVVSVSIRFYLLLGRGGLFFFSLNVGGTHFIGWIDKYER